MTKSPLSIVPFSEPNFPSDCFLSRLFNCNDPKGMMFDIIILSFLSQALFADPWAGIPSLESGNPVHEKCEPFDKRGYARKKESYHKKVRFTEEQKSFALHPAKRGVRSRKWSESLGSGNRYFATGRINLVADFCLD